MIGVVNLGNSNLKSLTNSLDYLKIEYIIISKAEEFKNIYKIILPGVGTFGNAMEKLKQLGLIDIIFKEVSVNKKPILGICLGMQLLFETSTETANIKGLSLLEGKVISLPKSKDYNIPRIGWAESYIKDDFLGLKKDKVVDFYYIHSFYVKTKHNNIVSIITDEEITAAVHYKNIYGCQFHPEKSYIHGLNILKSFSELEIEEDS